MANNRMLLCHKPSGRSVYLGKRMGWGWYGTPKNVAEKITELFEWVEHNRHEQDSFVVAMEYCSDKDTQVYTKWDYTDEPNMIKGEEE